MKKELFFAKAHGLGNDFVLIKADEKLSNEQVKLIANNKLGIGCDQVLTVDKKNNVTIWNKDGSLAKMCMNGLRALGLWSENVENEFITEACKVKTKKINNDEVEISLLTETKISQHDTYFLVDVGNLHKIFILHNAPEKLSEYQVQEHNLSFLWKNNEKWHARTIERGVGETLACGSAALAMASVLNSIGETNLNIYFQLGAIKHIKKNNQLAQIGPATIFAQGTLYI